MSRQTAVHEILEAHELLTFKTLCLTKSATMSGVAQDPELIGILAKDEKIGAEHVKQLKSFILNRGEA